MPETIEAKVTAERLRDVFGRAGTPIYAASIILSGIAIENVVLLWFIIDSWWPTVWAVGLIGLQASVALFVAAFHRRPRSDVEVRRWGRRKVVQEAIHGLGWGACLPLLYHFESDATLLVAVTTLVGLVSAAAPGYAVHLPTATAFLSAALLPPMAYLFVAPAPDIAGYAAVVLMATYVLSMANALRWSTIYRESIQLRLDLASGIDERRELLEAAEEGRRLAEVATADRTRFYSAASHDLRQPVHALGLYASLLRRDPARAERRELIDNIAACVGSLEKLFDAVLDLARPAGLPAEGRAFAVHDLVASSVLNFRPDAERRGLTLEASPTAAWAQGDPAAVERILGNLVSNAVRYTEVGGVRIRIRAGGARVAITVSDTGPGLSKADQDRIFDPFYRLPGARDGPRDGLGLGLATVRELCRNHGYGISVRSRLGRGSFFRLSLPAGSAGPIAVEDTESSITTGLQVLLVEDDPHVADAAARLLTSWGVAVQSCRDGERALAIIAERPEERWHVLLDYRLEGAMNGLQVADLLRQRHGDELAITLITGEADPELFAAAAARDLPVLRKPLKPIRLRALLSAEAGG